MRTDSLASIFLRFLRFGLLAWGGPVAQIGMLRHELVDELRWVEPQRFNRVLGMYQLLPGPEATELAIYLGSVRRGRLGGLLAGLGFVLPGLVLMLVGSWLYVRHGLASAAVAGAFAGLSPAVAAIVLRAVQRIGSHALHGRWLWAIALASAATQLAGAHFAIPLLAGGAAAVLAARGRTAAPAIVLAVALLLAGAHAARDGGSGSLSPGVDQRGGNLSEPGLAEVGVAGLRAGLLTFGGAYTAIPFIEHDAVREGNWLTQSQFLDGLAISTALPAPLIIFASFVGYVASGLPAALLMTAAVFAPAFAFTLLWHRRLEQAVDQPRLHALLDGVTAAVVGLIAVTALRLSVAAVDGVLAACVLALALLVLWRWPARAAMLVVLAFGGVVGVASAYAG